MSIALVLQTYACKDVELPVSGATVKAATVDVHDGKVVRTSQVTVRPKGVDEDDTSKNFNFRIYPHNDDMGLGMANENAKYDDIRWSHSGGSTGVDVQSIVTEFMDFIASWVKSSGSMAQTE